MAGANPPLCGKVVAAGPAFAADCGPGTLARIHSAAENDFFEALRDASDATKPALIGARVTMFHGLRWPPASGNIGDPVEFHNLGSSPTIDFFNNERCIVLAGSTGQWAQVSCSPASLSASNALALCSYRASDELCNNGQLDAFWGETATDCGGGGCPACASCSGNPCGSGACTVQATPTGPTLSCECPAGVTGEFCGGVCHDTSDNNVCQCEGPGASSFSPSGPPASDLDSQDPMMTDGAAWMLVRRKGSASAVYAAADGFRYV